MTQPLADIGLIGLAVMGENFALNMESKGFRVAVYNRTVERVQAFLAARARGKNFVGAHTPAETALSILAEILATRASRDGGRLKTAAGRIHAEVA